MQFQTGRRIDCHCVLHVLLPQKPDIYTALRIPVALELYVTYVVVLYRCSGLMREDP